MFVDWLKAQAAAAPGRPALLGARGERWSYAALDAAVEQTAARLSGLGLAAGDFLATLLPASPEHVFIVHAAARLGLGLAPLNTRLTSAELVPQLQKLGSRVRVLIGLPDARQTGLADNGLRLLSPAELDAQPELPSTPPAFDLNRLQGLIFTSGTTGGSKAVQLTFANHFWSAQGSAARIGILPTDTWLSPLPLYHVGGLANLFRCALAGAALQLCDPDPLALQAGLAAGATLVSLVPTMLKRLLALPNLEANRLRLVLLGGAAADPGLLAEAAQRGLRVAATYGLTEAASQVATIDPDSPAQMAKPGSVGRPLLNTRLRIVTEDGADLPPGSPGEVLVQGPTVMAGYFGDPQASELALQSGWLHTGDLGYLDGEGCLWLLQRRSDLIISGGENIYPAEIEAVLAAHPAVADTCVVGLPDPERGQHPAALVVLKPACPITAPELLAFARQSLAGYKLPKGIHFVPALPQTASGKIARHQVQEMLARLESEKNG